MALEVTQYPVHILLKLSMKPLGVKMEEEFSGRKDYEFLS